MKYTLTLRVHSSILGMAIRGGPKYWQREKLSQAFQNFKNISLLLVGLMSAKLGGRCVKFL